MQVELLEIRDQCHYLSWFPVFPGTVFLTNLNCIQLKVGQLQFQFRPAVESLQPISVNIY